MVKEFNSGVFSRVIERRKGVVCIGGEIEWR